MYIGFSEAELFLRNCEDAVSEKELSLTVAYKHMKPSLQQVMELLAYLRASLDRVVGDKRKLGRFAHF